MGNQVLGVENKIHRSKSTRQACCDNSIGKACNMGKCDEMSFCVECRPSSAELPRRKKPFTKTIDECFDCQECCNDIKCSECDCDQCCDERGYISDGDICRDRCCIPKSRNFRNKRRLRKSLKCKSIACKAPEDCFVDNSSIYNPRKAGKVLPKFLKLQSMGCTDEQRKNILKDLKLNSHLDKTPKNLSLSTNDLDQDPTPSNPPSPLPTLSPSPPTPSSKIPPKEPPKISLAITPKCRSVSRIRNDLLRKLTYTNIWLTPCEKPNSSQNIIIFDWDDTLFSTTYVNSREEFDKGRTCCPSVKKGFGKLDKAVERVLKLSISMGDTYIVTNSQRQWVDYTAEMYLPRVKCLLDKITVISARDEFCEKYPNKMDIWKQKAFLKVSNDYPSWVILNLIVLGDSHSEINAAKLLAEKYPHNCIKTVKFKEFPTQEILIKQVCIVTKQLRDLLLEPKNLAIKLK